MTSEFSFFSLNSINNNSNLELTLLKESISFNESVRFSDINFKPKFDQVDLINTREFVKNPKNENFTQNISHINQGLLELLTTITEPKLFQSGLNALNILIKKALGTPEEFTKKLFTVFAFDFIIKDKTKVLNTILRSFPPKQALLIYEGDSDYSLNRYEQI